MASMLPGMARTCLGCLRRTAILPPVSLPTTALQTRGKKNYRKKGSMRDGFVVRLQSNIKGYGPKGTIMRVAKGRFRNIWFPQKMATRITDKEFARLGLKPEDIQPRDTNFGNDAKVEKINLQMRLYELEKQARRAQNIRTVLDADGAEVEVPEGEEQAEQDFKPPVDPNAPKITVGGKKRMRKAFLKRTLTPAEKREALREARRVALRQAERAERNRKKRLYDGIASIEKTIGYKNKQEKFRELTETHREISRELATHPGLLVQAWDPAAREHRWLEPSETLKLLTDGLPDVIPAHIPHMGPGPKRDPHDKTKLAPRKPHDPIFVNATIQDVLDGVHAFLATSKTSGASDIRFLPTDLTFVRARPTRAEKRHPRFGARFAVNIRIAGDPATVDKFFALYGKVIRGPDSIFGRKVAAARKGRAQPAADAAAVEGETAAEEAREKVPA